MDGPDSIPSESLEGEEARFVARDVPPMGYRTYVPLGPDSAPSKPSNLVFDDKAMTLEGPFFKITFGKPLGRIQSLVDKQSARELVDRGASPGLGSLLYERFDSNDVHRFVDSYVKIQADWALNELGKPNLPPASQVPYQAIAPVIQRMGGQNEGQVSLAVTLEAAPASFCPKSTTKVTLYRDLPFVDFEIKLLAKEADPWPEAGWFCFPLNVNEPQFRLGRLGSIIDPAKDIVPGSNHHLFGVNSGLAMIDPAGKGVGLCAIDSPLVSLDTPGCWKYSRDFVPKKPVAFVNLFNNQWTTNFRLWNRGTWISRVRLWSINRYEAEPALLTPSLEARYPLQAASADGAAGDMVAAQAGIEVSRRGVLVTAFGPSMDGDNLVLRLWEQAGESGECKVRLPAGLRTRTVRPINLRGEPQGERKPVANDTFSMNVRGFAPASFLLERE